MSSTFAVSFNADVFVVTVVSGCIFCFVLALDSDLVDSDPQVLVILVGGSVHL